MSRTPFLKSNLAKLLMIIAAAIIIIGLGAILFYYGTAFRRRSLGLRMSYMAIAVIWSVGTIWWMLVRFNIRSIWNNFLQDIYNHDNDYERKLFKQFQVLKAQYPTAIAEYENECWKKRPRPTNPEIMEGALAIPEDQWATNEAGAVARIKAKQAAKRTID